MNNDGFSQKAHDILEAVSYFAKLEDVALASMARAAIRRVYDAEHRGWQGKERGVASSKEVSCHHFMVETDFWQMIWHVAMIKCNKSHGISLIMHQ